MPEGDTIHRVAARLRPAIVGKKLTRFEALRLAGELPLPGERVDSVEVTGKHLVVNFSGGLALRVHLRMHGTWHLYKAGSRWRRAPRAARVVIDVGDWVAVCFDAPDVAVTRVGHEAITHLGPDLCDADPDFASIVDRARTIFEGDTIGELVMDQRIASGIGNVFKSEALWAEAIDPTTPVSDLDDDSIERAYRRAHEQLRANLDRPGHRRTYRDGHAAYRRGGQACPRCGERIVRIMQGADQPRSTYYCPGCQE